MDHFGRTKLLFLILASTLLGACAETSYLYRPSQQATAQVSGLPAARYSIPPERPQGEVLVVSTGVTEIKPDNVPARALFARVIVSNNADESTWRLDTRKQAAVIGGNRIAPTYVNTFGESLPVVQIAKGEKRTIDFYFPLPVGTETNGDLPQFDLSWNVDTGTRPIAERTSFDRFRVEPVYSGGPYYSGYPATAIPTIPAGVGTTRIGGRITASEFTTMVAGAIAAAMAVMAVMGTAAGAAAAGAAVAATSVAEAADEARTRAPASANPAQRSPQSIAEDNDDERNSSVPEARWGWGPVALRFAPRLSVDSVQFLDSVRLRVGLAPAGRGRSPR